MNDFTPTNYSIGYYVSLYDEHCLIIDSLDKLQLVELATRILDMVKHLKLHGYAGIILNKQARPCYYGLLDDRTMSYDDCINLASHLLARSLTV
jgi:hypothetical protein